MSSTKQAPKTYAGRMAFTIYRCPNDRMTWWLGLEDTVLKTHVPITPHACRCHSRPEGARPERVRCWPIGSSTVASLLDALHSHREDATAPTEVTT